MRPDFLQSYYNSFSSIEGAFQFDAALLFMAYNELVAAEGISGNVLEIGVRHGLSAIAIAAMRGKQRQFFAVDLFDDLQLGNDSQRGGSGNREVFVQNMQDFFEDIDFIQVIASNSNALLAEDLGSDFSFCHIDGGHSDKETYSDLRLCSELLMPGGLLALDDYFNPLFPGVAEGAVRFNLDHKDVLKPVAIGFNKVLFQKSISSFNVNERFSRVFSFLPKDSAILWGIRANLFWSSLQRLFDLGSSTPSHLIAKSDTWLRAKYEPQSTTLSAKPSEFFMLPVLVTNECQVPFESGVDTFGLSFHVLSSEGVMLKLDNARHYFSNQLNPGEQAWVELPILAPAEPGAYLIEIDLVWEGIAWFKDRGSPTCLVNLNVLDLS